MNPHEVVPAEVERERGLQILQLLAEGVGQPREAAACHADREVLPLHVACRDVVRVRLAIDHGWDRVHDLRWGVAAHAGVDRTEQLDELAEVRGIRTPGPLDGPDVGHEAVRGELESETLGQPP